MSTVPSIFQLAGSLIVTFLLYSLYQIVKFFYVEITCPIRDLPGPKNPSLLFGNFKEIKSDVSLVSICLVSWRNVHSRSWSFGRIGSQNTGG